MAREKTNKETYNQLPKWYGRITFAAAVFAAGAVLGEVADKGVTAFFEDFLEEIHDDRFDSSDVILASSLVSGMFGVATVFFSGWDEHNSGRHTH